MLLLVMGCGSVTATGSDAGLEAAAGSSGAAGSSSSSDAALEHAAAADVADSREASVEVGRAPLVKCSGTETIQVEKCFDYYAGLRCATKCQDEKGTLHPSGAEQLAGATACQQQGNPSYSGTLICVPSCADCPAAAPEL